MSDQMEYDLEALNGAAKFFEDMATGANSAPLAFAQAIRRVIEVTEMEMEMEAEFAADFEADNQVVENVWQRFVESMPAAKVVNDNQPNNQAVIVVLRDPPTLPIGTLLYASYQGMKDNAVALEILEVR